VRRGPTSYLYICTLDSYPNWTATFTPLTWYQPTFRSLPPLSLLPAHCTVTPPPYHRCLLPSRVSRVAILPTGSRRPTPHDEELGELVPLEETDFFQGRCSEIRSHRRPPRSGRTEPTVATSTASPVRSVVRRLDPASIHA
jgi:hypothetical protein